MESSDSMDMDEEVAVGLATGVGDEAHEPEEAPGVDFEDSAEPDEDQDIPSAMPLGLPSASVHKSSRGGVRGESGQRLANDKFFNAFEDDFDESDMRLDVRPNQPAA
jgi:hypothetical protein